MLHAFSNQQPLRGWAAAASTKVFIDGSAGTTGLQVRDRLSGRKDITLVSPPDASRKDPDARRLCMLESDATILCLPDEVRPSVVVVVSTTSLIIVSPG